MTALGRQIGRVVGIPGSPCSNAFKRRASSVEQVNRFLCRSSLQEGSTHARRLQSYYLWSALRGGADHARDPMTGRTLGVSDSLHHKLGREAYKAKFRYMYRREFKRVMPLPG